MKKIVKTSAFLLVSTALFSSCGDTAKEAQNDAEIKNESKDAGTEEVNQQKSNAEKVIVSTDDSTQGLFKMGMSIDEVLNVVNDNNFEVIKMDENGYLSKDDYEIHYDELYDYDERGVMTLDKELFNWDNATYLLDVKGDFRFIFDENSELISLTLHHPFAALSKNDVESYLELNEDNILYEILDTSQPIINLSSTPQDVIDVYGEPDEIVESDGLVNYYEYMINEDLYLEVLTDGKSQDFIYQINYTNYKPFGWVDKDNISN